MSIKACDENLQVQCQSLFKELLAKMDASPPTGPMSNSIPEELREEFLLGNHINLTLQYYDERHNGETVPYDWNASVIGAHSAPNASQNTCS